MKKLLILITLVVSQQAFAGENNLGSPSDSNKGRNDEAIQIIRDPNSDFTKDYQRQVSSTSETAGSSQSEDSSYHDKVLLRFSKMR